MPCSHNNPSLTLSAPASFTCQGQLFENMSNHTSNTHLIIWWNIMLHSIWTKYVKVYMPWHWSGSSNALHNQPMPWCHWEISQDQVQVFLWQGLSPWLASNHQCWCIHSRSLWNPAPPFYLPLLCRDSHCRHCSTESEHVFIICSLYAIINTKVTTNMIRDIICNNTETHVYNTRNVCKINTTHTKQFTLFRDVKTPLCYTDFQRY